jgi:hypothetical protein
MIFFWKQSDVRAIDALQANVTLMKGSTEVIKLMLDDWPTSLDKVSVETIWTQRFITG